MVDHVNGNTLDNRRENLRICSRSENGWNTKIRKNNKSGYRGVSWKKDKNKWVARVSKNRQHIFIGFFNHKHMSIKLTP